MILFRNAATAALCFWFSASLTACPEGCPKGTVWQPNVNRDDLRACQGARAGEAWSADSRFYGCMQSMGYREVCQ